MSEIKVRKLEARNDTVMVLPDADNDQSANIIVPENAREKPQTGTVVSAGPDCKKLDVGDAVIFGKYAGYEMEFEGTKYLMIRDADIFGKLV